MSNTVATRDGRIEGIDQSGLLVFKGVPYAAPPVGALRWMPPAKAAPWTGTRDARSFSPVAHQNKVQIAALTAMTVAGEMNEDCLYLNVWTPGTTGTPRPVMVWIHGGGFTIGAGSQEIYDGSVLARRGDAVIVTINYRLGPLGFLRLTDITNGRIASTGNEGILDQIAALEWVRDNIAEFGGDPANVTIFGESAGGMSVGTLLGAPQARGLFNRAIPQSGSCNTASPVKRADHVAEYVMKTLGVSPAHPDALHALTPEALLKGTLLPNGMPNPELGMAYQPVVDGHTLPQPAIDLVAEGAAAEVAVMVGSTAEEWKLFSMMDAGIGKLDRKGLGARISRRMAPEAADALIEAYEKARGARGDSTAPAELFSAIETDRVFRVPGIRLAETQSRLEPNVYSYLFTWKSPAMQGMLGSCHALELGFVFGTNNNPGMKSFSGTGPDADRLATEIQDAWLAFARTGNPSCKSVGDWPRYTEAGRATMLFGARTARQDAPFDEERRAWDAIASNVIGAL
jgi:para-nitrobenzyl esterase